jgi:hypothetical protein
MEETSLTTPPLSEDQRHLVELYAREPNVTKIAGILGVHRTTVYRRLDEPGVQEAVVELRMKLDGERNQQIEEAQDDALTLIRKQLKSHLRRAASSPDGASIQDTQRLMQIAEKLGNMKKDVKAAAASSMAAAREGSGEDVDWDKDPSEDL